MSFAVIVTIVTIVTIAGIVMASLTQQAYAINAGSHGLDVIRALVVGGKGLVACRMDGCDHPGP